MQSRDAEPAVEEPAVAAALVAARGGEGVGGSRPAAARVMALQRAAGNRSVIRLLAAGAGAGARTLARAPSVAERVEAAAEQKAWKRATALLAALPMRALLDACAALEADGKLVWIEVNLDSSAPKARLERIFAAIAVVQRAPADEQLAHRLALGRADDRALAAWIVAHPDPSPAADPGPDPITRADGAVFDPPTSVKTDAAWTRAMLRFFHVGPAPGPASADTCLLDGQPSTAEDVALFVAEAGLFRGGHAIDPQAARAIVEAYLLEAREARAIALEVETKLKDRDLSAIVERLRAVPMPALLAALDAVRGDGKLDELTDKLTPVPPQPRLTAALLAAGGHGGLRYAAAISGLPDPELEALRTFLFERAIYDDIPAPVRLLKAHADDPDRGKPFDRPAGADAMWAATVDDPGWVRAFLDYFRFMRIPYEENSFWFNETVRALDEIIDITVEQAALAGRALSAELVRKTIAANIDSFYTRAPVEADQIVLQYTFVPVTTHRDLSSGQRSKDKPAQQFAAQYTIKFKNVGSAYSEIDVSALVQATFFADPATSKPKLDPQTLELQNLVGGLQVAWVRPLFTKKVQLQAIVQAVAGAARDYHANADGTLTIRGVGGGGPAVVQAAAQLQVVVQPFDGLGLQFFVGTQESMTWVGPLTTLDGTRVLGGIQWAFDVGG